MYEVSYVKLESTSAIAVHMLCQYHDYKQEHFIVVSPVIHVYHDEFI